MFFWGYSHQRIWFYCFILENQEIFIVCRPIFISSVKNMIDFVKISLTLSKRFLYWQKYRTKIFIFWPIIMKELDHIQKALIAFFKKNTNQEGITLREIANNIGASHPQTVLNKLNQLVLKGYFVKDENGYRLIRENITDNLNDIVQLPIYGFAQCGNKWKKILDEYTQEKIPATMAMLGIKDVSRCFLSEQKGIVWNQRSKMATWF